VRFENRIRNRRARRGGLGAVAVASEEHDR
jgi:hypothetical protein